MKPRPLDYNCGGSGRVRQLGVEAEAEAARGREGSTGVAQVLPLGVGGGGGGGGGGGCGALGAPPPRGAAPPGGAARDGVRVGAGGADREGHLRLPLHGLPRHRWLAPRLGSVPCFLKGSVHVMNAFVDYYLHGGGKPILMLLEAIELVLIGTVTFVLGIGLYELFISTIDSSYGSNLFGLFSLPDRPKWVEIKSLNDLKTKLGHVIVLVLLVGIFEKSKRVTITSCADLFMLCWNDFPIFSLPLPTFQAPYHQMRQPCPK